jgi:hypothetical protein
MAGPYRFVEIECPESGMPITVRRTLDAIGQLFANNQIDRTQHEAARAFEADLDAMAGSLRAQSHGPTDLTWRSRRPGSNGKAADRLKRAGKDLEHDQIATIQAGLAGLKVDVRTLCQALNKLAVVYGLSTVTRHWNTNHHHHHQHQQGLPMAKSPAKQAVADFLLDLSTSKITRADMIEFAEILIADYAGDSTCLICGGVGSDDGGRDEIDEMDHLDKKRFADIDRMKRRGKCHPDFVS